MCALRLSVLGGFRAEWDGVPVGAFESDKARALLAYLAVEGHRSHRRDALIGLFWPEMPEQRALHNLSQALSSLRSVLPRDPEHPLFEATPQEIRIRDDACWLDSGEMGALLQACQTHGHDPERPCRACTDRLERVAALYRGDFLAGLYLKGCAAFDEWQTAQRESLRARLIEALRALSQSLERSGDFERALAHARRQTELDPLDEPAHRQGMRLLAQSGRRSDALAQYDVFRKALLDEVGVEPEAGTTALYQLILRESAGSSFPSLGFHNLPPPLTRLVGREADVEALRLALSGDACRLVTIVGGGGSGKTHLALETARRLVPNYADGVCLVELDRSRPEDSLAPLIATAVGLSPPPDPGTFTARARPALEERLYNFLVGRRLLLVLDGFESLLHESRWLGGLLRRAPGLSVLATSRVRLKLEAEQVVILDGLPYPTQPATPEEMATYSAVQLFVATARRARPDFELDTANGDSVARVCRALQGMPLGILLAAAWAEVLEPAQIAANITDQAAELTRRGLDFLATDWADLPDRQRSVRATFEYSLTLLGEPARDALLRLSVFRGAFPAERALQVAGVDLRTLKVLVDHSVLQPMGDGWFRIHEVLRQVALEKLAAEPTRAAAAREQHCTVLLIALAAREPRMKTDALFAELAEIDREYMDLLDAWDWAADHGHTQLLDRASWTVARYQDLRDLPRDGALRCERTMVGLETRGLDSESLPLWARLGIGRARHLIRQHDAGSAQALLDQVELALRKAPVPLTDLRREMAHLSIARGFMCWATGGNHLEVLLSYELGLELMVSTEDSWDIGYALLHVARGHEGAGNLRECLRFADLGLETQRPSGDPALISDLMRHRGFALMLLGRSEAALRNVDERATYMRRQGDRYSMATIVAERGLALYHGGRYREAQPLVEQAVALLSRPDEISERIFYTWILDLIYLAAGDHSAVRLGPDLRDEDRADLEQTDWRFSVPFTWAILDLLRGDWVKAEQNLLVYTGHMKEITRLDMVGSPLALLALTAERRGDGDLARLRLMESLESGLRQQYFLAQLTALGVSALFAAEARDLEEAVELYATATSHPAAADAQWFQDFLGAPVARLTEALPVGVRQAAQTRGRACDPEAAAAEVLAKLKAMA